MFRRPYLQVAYTEKNSIRLCKTFHVHSCVPAHRIDHSSVPSTPMTAFPCWSTVVGDCTSRKSSPLTSICVLSNVCVMNEAQNVGYFITRSHGRGSLSFINSISGKGKKCGSRGHQPPVGMWFTNYLYLPFMHLASYLRL